jgi:plastocyanin
VFPGPAVRIYPVPAIPTGVYYFQCDVHPGLMNGTVRAGGAKGPGPGVPPPSGSPPPGSPSPQPSPGGSVIALVAKGLSFNSTSLTFPAGKPVLIDFKNEDAQTPHNFSLYGDATLKTNLFRGEPVTGPGETAYRFPAPGPGTYYFQCDYHPQQMHGTVRVQ